jgi:hypothetical protein
LHRARAREEAIAAALGGEIARPTRSTSKS